LGFFVLEIFPNRNTKYLSFLLLPQQL